MSWTDQDVTRLEAYADGVRVANSVARKEMDAAYRRGFEEGRDSISALPVLLVGVVLGALSVGAWVALF